MTATGAARQVHLRRAAVTLVGAVVMLVAIRSRLGPLGFVWVPLFSAAIYVGAAAAGGRRSSYWSPACVLVPLGTTIAVLDVWDAKVNTAAVYLVAAGVGILLAALAERAGVSVSLLGVGSCVAAFGLLYFADRYWVEVVGRVETYAAAYALWAAFELVRGLRTPPTETGESTGGRGDHASLRE